MTIHHLHSADDYDRDEIDAAILLRSARRCQLERRGLDSVAVAVRLLAETGEVPGWDDALDDLDGDDDGGLGVGGMTECDQCTQRDAVLDNVIDERDRQSKLLDEMTAKIAALCGADFGEHSSGNDPWRNAVEALQEWADCGSGTPDDGGLIR